jgi:hypothetical protein
MKEIKITTRLIVRVIVSIGVFFLVIWLMANLPDIIRGISK